MLPEYTECSIMSSTSIGDWFPEIINCNSLVVKIRSQSRDITLFNPYKIINNYKQLHKLFIIQIKNLLHNKQFIKYRFKENNIIAIGLKELFIF